MSNVGNFLRVLPINDKWGVKYKKKPFSKIDNK